MIHVPDQNRYDQLFRLHQRTYLNEPMFDGSTALLAAAAVVLAVFLTML